MAPPKRFKAEVNEYISPRRAVKAEMVWTCADGGAEDGEDGATGGKEEDTKKSIDCH